MEPISDLLTVRGLTRLSYSASTNGAVGVVSELSKLVNGWAIVLDRHGSPVATSGASRIHINDALAVASGRSSEARTKDLMRFTVGKTSNPIATLVVSPKGRKVSQVTLWSEHASSLLALVADPLRSAKLDRIAKEDALDLLLCGDAALAQRCADRWGLSGEKFTVVLFGATARSLVIESIVSGWLGDENITECLASRREGLCLVLETRHVPSLISTILRSAEISAKSFHCGVGTPLQLGRLNTSLQQARAALEVAIADRSAVQEYAQLDSVRLVLQALTPAEQEALLGPIRALEALGEDAFLEHLQAMQVFLAENGAWEASANQLRIHRHTLRARISRIEEATGMSLSTSDDRLSLLLAVRAYTQSVRS